MIQLSVPEALSLLSLVAFLTWSSAVWRMRDLYRRHERMPSIPRDLMTMSLLMLLGGQAITGNLHGKEMTWLIDLIALTVRSSVMASGVLALWATRKPEPTGEVPADDETNRQAEDEHGSIVLGPDVDEDR